MMFVGLLQMAKGVIKRKIMRQVILQVTGHYSYPHDEEKAIIKYKLEYCSCNHV